MFNSMALFLGEYAENIYLLLMWPFCFFPCKDDDFENEGNGTMTKFKSSDQYVCAYNG